MNNSFVLSGMSTDLDNAIEEIKEKLKGFTKRVNKVKLTSDLKINKNYFADLNKKKSFTISELVLFSEHFGYDFFSHIKLKDVKNGTESTNTAKKATISVTIEVNDLSKKRIILESVLDKNSVKKLMD